MTDSPHAAFSLALGMGLLSSLYDSTSVVVSPYSLRQALPLLAAGAQGATHKELQTFIHRSTYSPWNLSTAVQFHTADALWLDSSFHLDSTSYRFNELSSPQVFQVPMQTRPQATVQQVNRWAKSHTSGKITQLLSPAHLQGVELLITSALYFRGAWQYPFHPKNTYQALFHGSKKQKEVSFMMQKHEVLYAETSDYCAISLPFADTALSLFLVLPMQTTASPLACTPSQLMALFRALDTVEVRIAIPKFNITSTHNLLQPLCKWGLSHALSSQADYTAFTGTPNGLHVASVLQNCTFSAHEEGVEAAAATAIMMLRSAEQKTFIATHPFLFVLYHHTLAQPLFMGVYDCE